MALPTWAPTVRNVGAQLRARTKDRGGTELGTFSAETRPTANQVQELIESEVADLLAIIPEGVTLPAGLVPRMARAARLGTAVQIELGYFPEQVATGRSPYAQLKELYDEALAAITSALVSEGVITDTGTSGTTAPPPPRPVAAFPATIPGWLTDTRAW